MDQRRRNGMRSIVILLALLAIGCPGRTKRQVGGPVAVPTNGNKQALRRFEESRSRFQGDPSRKAQVATEFEAIAREYPEDPIAPHARLYAGMSALDAGQAERAVDNLEEVVEDETAGSALKMRGQLFYGIALQAVGRTKDALYALEQGAESLDPDNRDERAGFHAAFAEAAVVASRTVEAIGHYDAWYAVGRAAERAYALARIRALTDLLDEASVVRAYERLENKGGPGAALVGVRLAAQLDGRGESDKASQVRDETRGAREQLGLSSGSGGGGGGTANPDRVGAILSLSGKRNQLGDRSMRGLALVSGSFEDEEAGAGIKMPKPFQLSVRDDASQSAVAVAAIDALAAEGVIAVVGPDDKGSVERAAQRANDLGLPLVSLHPAAELLVGTSSPVVFHAVHSAEQRARSLARNALAAGTRDFAVFAPDNGYGRAVGAAFANEVQRGKGTVVVEAKYPAGATSFADPIKKLRKPFEAVFVPDNAKALELIAPALAAANLVARPPGGKTKQGRPIWILSTAEQLTPAFLGSAGRYSWGAMLAPGFYADRTDARIAEFTAMYERAFGRPPSALDAYAFDAAWVIRAAVESGAKTRGDVASTLASGKLDGLTGAITFDSSHHRKDDGILFEVVEVRPNQFELRARR